MITITNKLNCCGCSACAQICPEKCIRMESDAEGFLYPKADAALCVDCGLCEKVCPVIHSQTRKETVLSAYAGYVTEEAVRLDSSSGGLFTPLAQYILENNGVVFGAALDSDHHVYHLAITSMDELSLLRGSKYVQSEINQVFIQAKAFLDEGKTVLFTGTSCQISGLKRFLRKDYPTLFTVDVLCHGTPSPKVWNRYLADQQAVYGAAVQYVFFRRKKNGWKKYSVELKFADSTTYLNDYRQDPFMQLFLGNICLRPSCYDCKFKALERDSDLTLGDAWGINKIMPELDDDKGTSIVLVHSTKGQDLLNHIMDQLVMKQGDVNMLLPPTADSRKSVSMHPNREKFFEELDAGKTCRELTSLLIPPMSLFGRMKYKLKRWIKKVIRR